MESTDKNLVAIIMAGGVGTRFWPLSTHERPKQFIQLFDDRSLLQKKAMTGWRASCRMNA